MGLSHTLMVQAAASFYHFKTIVALWFSLFPVISALLHDPMDTLIMVSVGQAREDIRILG